MADCRIAGIAVCAGVENADAGVGEAVAKRMGKGLIYILKDA